VGNQGRRFRLGLFMLGAGMMFLALLGFILESSLRSEQVPYLIMFEENVKGMVVGSKVNFQGVPVGVVSDMRFQDGKTLVELSVDPTRATIQDVTKARMDRLLVTGQVTVELEGYDRSGKALLPGSFIEPKRDPLDRLRGSLPGIVEQASGVLTRFDALLERAEQMLGDGNQARVADILDNLAGVTADLRARTLPAADAMLADGRNLAVESQQMVKDARAAAAALLRLEPGLATLVRDVEGFVHEASTFTDSLRAPTQDALASLRQTLVDVRALARQLELAPQSLLFGVKRPTAAPFGGGR